MFSCRRALDRHMKTASVHNTEESPMFQCRCGYRSTRKDHHTRHLAKTKCSGDRPYQCQCGQLSINSAQHEGHYKDCRKGRRGRPRKQKRSQDHEKTTTERVSGVSITHSYPCGRSTCGICVNHKTNVPSEAGYCQPNT